MNKKETAVLATIEYMTALSPISDMADDRFCWSEITLTLNSTCFVEIMDDSTVLICLNSLIDKGFIVLIGDKYKLKYRKEVGNGKDRSVQYGKDCSKCI